ncbi:leucyl/phenylalanyl-tRNA--protein transferase [Erythrobacter ani]|uniref:Leucyl/phenylalanyl-tRNA--protein transferase n=1 Tax=Erythrobacter ani TaxID=2827235 RepID=A0ABS6SKV7_9SPHN|nr:leucyl/phenylalanyl-tRNA--protein transferase [Erythrobacter ani]MBV7265088.1 leucyl/phenylalanyl-tRNA--protein transferase [Erythrobacter ani]
MHSPFSPLIPVDTLLLAYRSGIFPMADTREDTEIFWVEPRDRAIIPLENLHISRSLRKVLRSDRYSVTINRDFSNVIRACSKPRPGHPESWISNRIIASYEQLHESGHAHSVECWLPEDNGEPVLAGGLYGVAFDSVFCGESMFSRASDASKVALCWLVALMQNAGFTLLDCQFMTDHLAFMGAVEIPQQDYLSLVSEACGKTDKTLAQAYRDLVETAREGHSSPGKLIAQSLTQTS